MLFFYVFYASLDDSIFDVLSSQIRIPIRSYYGDIRLEINLDYRHIEGASSKVKDQDLFRSSRPRNLLRVGILNRSRSWLVDNQLTIKSRQLASFPGCLPLLLFKVGRNSNHTFQTLVFCLILRGL